MELFKFYENEVITSEYLKADLQGLEKVIKDPGFATFGLPKSRGALHFTKDFGPSLKEEDFKDQFIIFQFSNKLDQPSILESSEVNPIIDGSMEESDVLVDLAMQSFHIAENQDIDKNTRATMRINIGKDENSRDKYFDTVFWSIAAGLNLYDSIKNKPAKPNELKSDFGQVFRNKPIEIPGGLCKMTFEVVKHREPKWWQRIFRFLQSETGKSLTSTLGFPGITNQAINLIDELLNKLDKSEPEILFKSKPLRLALSKQAKDDYTAGNERIKIGCLNPGYCVLARGRDFMNFIESDAVYYSTYDKLVPSSVSPADLVSGNYDDPFKDVTYSIFRVGMEKTKLNPMFSYR